MRDTSDFVLPKKRVGGETLRERLSENVYERVLPARYLRTNAAGEVIETPAEMFERVAAAVASAEREYGTDADAATWEQRFYEAMAGLAFMPNSPTLMNAGAEIQQLAACFVLSPEDSLDSIFGTLGRAANVMQSGGGVGYSFSKLRPRGDRIRSTGGVASGPVSFMNVYDTMCEQIRQGGRRRGAQMGILHVTHPDVGRFCTVKREQNALTNFNLSVAITDDFYDAVQEGSRYTLQNPSTGGPHEVTEATAQFYSTAYESAPRTEVERNLWRDYAEEIPRIDEYRGETDLEVGAETTLPARFVWELVVDGTWQNGEPGLFMIDETNRQHSFDVEQYPSHRIDATNPCAEQGLEEYEACTLGHVNLSLLVDDDAVTWSEFHDEGIRDLPAAVETFLEQAIDWERLNDLVHLGTRFLDDVLTVSEFPIDEIDETVGRMRKIGLGILGLAELLIQLGVRYDSPPAREIARQLMAAINRESTQTSHELAVERGSFPDWEHSKYAAPTDYPEWFERHTGDDPEEWADGFPLRNHNTTTIAPTGTTGMIANTSGGCEPLFNVLYFKNVSEDVQGEAMLVEFDEYFLRALEANGIDPVKIRERALSLLEDGTFERPADLPIPTGLAELFVTAGEISATDHVRMQAALQAHVDSGISKTVNLAHDATREDIADAYALAIELGCKGITAYRDRSRHEQVLTTRPSESDDASGRPSEARCCPSWLP
ncbi:adenosylcobalamin-dependent ribonucleoside-diphosphate reductase [Halobellus sp. Atlit-38R]|uniref:adenosylcobalamin-dependent ribonucleoside-diphosphate reductase n=1 Tax=Halobellus sp. Atlit-38R TaxID=2282131 RepID=UPI000EF21372|nr:adenosylcobalamin-dependent ribonucleoside-diphosphate reductase [Halobellus sp. Atlit-38R]RLM89334.1 adenosylcobalamin-dependent ribonucleoside-diphosphate reductase [Halobellus sp. Atlit-38R]